MFSEHVHLCHVSSLFSLSLPFPLILPYPLPLSLSFIIHLVLSIFRQCRRRRRRRGTLASLPTPPPPPPPPAAHLFFSQGTCREEGGGQPLGPVSCGLVWPCLSAFVWHSFAAFVLFRRLCSPRRFLFRCRCVYGFHFVLSGAETD